ncbi:MAG: hypothetical protein OXM61_03280 [Candidatus Poribacteria bacterium]|nr:hypothetical protein [Candidatus Poribacteria bacterium]
MSESSNIIALLLNIKESEGLDVDDKLIKECYELQQKYQFDPGRNTVEKMRELVEASLDKAHGQ